MSNEEKFGQLASDQTIEKTIAALAANGVKAEVAENGEAAKQKVLKLIPAGAEVMDMTSVTIGTVSIVKEILESGRYNSVRNKLNKMDRKTQSAEMQKLGAAPDWAVGSVHAVTEGGSVVIASATGSQLPAYAYGATHVVWVVGAQKLVKNLDEAMKRLYEYTLPLEDERARKAYGMGSGVNKVLIVNKEVSPGRISMIIVKERLGF
ncbi:MAG: LUD domain-containing protein [Candidatus Doudnabacteria bacterium]|nr:LUD domain-containing protein [Candidatus Doudnabacteria bacterium]